MIEKLTQYARGLGLGDVGVASVIKAYEVCSNLANAPVAKNAFQDFFIEKFIDSDNSPRFGSILFFSPNCIASFEIFGQSADASIFALPDRITHCRIERTAYDFGSASAASRLYVEFSAAGDRSSIRATGKQCDELSQLVLKYIASNFRPYTPQAMRAQWNELASDRQRFWEIIRSHYTGLEGVDRSELLEDRMEKVGLPPFLPLGSTENLRDYRIIYGDQMTPEQLSLLDFCSRIYPARKGSEKLIDVSSIEDKVAFEAFHASRGKLSKFWNSWWEHGEDLLSLRKLTRDYNGQLTLLKLLCYLELALAERTRDPGVGKEHLFSLTVEWDRHTAGKRS
jgi:hypothetical protein